MVNLFLLATLFVATSAFAECDGEGLLIPQASQSIRGFQMHPHMKYNTGLFTLPTRFSKDPLDLPQIHMLRSVGYVSSLGGVIKVDPDWAIKNIYDRIDGLVALNPTLKNKVLYPGRIIKNAFGEFRVIRFDQPMPRGYSIAVDDNVLPSTIYWQAIAVGLFPIGNPQYLTEIYSERAHPLKNYFVLESTSDFLSHDLAHFGGFLEDLDFMIAIREIAQYVVTLSPKAVEKINTRLYNLIENMIVLKPGHGPIIHKELQNMGLKSKNYGEHRSQSYPQYLAALNGKSLEETLDIYNKLQILAPENILGAVPRDAMAMWNDLTKLHAAGFTYRSQILFLQKKNLMKHEASVKSAVAYALAHIDQFKNLTAAQIARQLILTEYEITDVYHFYCQQHANHFALLCK